MTILSLETIEKQFDERPLLRGVSLAIERGERVGLVGINGSGKTTLLRIAARTEQPDAGRVALARDARVAYLPQNPPMNPQQTALEHIFAGQGQAIETLRAYEQANAALAHSPDDTVLQQRMTELVAQMDSAGGVAT